MITTHVLDTSHGRPAAGVPVSLQSRAAERGWASIASGVTDADGRLRDLSAGVPLAPGTYRLLFDTASYFAATGLEGFYPEISVVFEVRDPEQLYHVPLLLSPYGYSTYRGS